MGMSDSLPGESVPTCETCGANFANQAELENHRRTHAGGSMADKTGAEQQWKCQQCGATFKSEEALIEHNQVAH